MVLNLVTANLKLGLVEFNWTFVIQILNTIVLYFFLKKLLFEPVTNFMENRENEIESQIADAQTMEEEANELKEKYESKLDGVKDEGRKIIKEARQKGDKKASEIVSNARDEAKEIRLKNQKELEREKTKAINELKDEISSLAILAASKVVQKDLSKEDHENLIKDFIDEVGDAKWQN
jgi:F-type H+-transporting ATPase subunit b